MQYVLLSEDNDWEGETWHTFLQWNGNEPQLRRLAEDVKRAEFDTQWHLPFDLILNPIEQSHVDSVMTGAALADIPDDHYGSPWAVVTGAFVWPRHLDADELEAVLYKGGIRDFFTGSDDDESTA